MSDLESFSLAENVAEFFEKNDALQEINATEALETCADFQNIDEMRDEIWLVQCPKDADVTNLVNKKLKLPGRSNFQEMESVSVKLDSPTVHTFGYLESGGKHMIRQLPITGSIIFRQTLKVNEPISLERIEKLLPLRARVPLPDFVKVRHPLLGVNYEDNLQLKTHVIDRLREAEKIVIQVEEELNLKKRKAKKNRLKNKSRSAMESTIPQIFVKTDIKTEPEMNDEDFIGVETQKSKKRKHQMTNFESETNLINGLSESFKKSKKLLEIPKTEDEYKWLFETQ